MFRDHLEAERGGNDDGDVFDTILRPRFVDVAVTSLSTWPAEGHRPNSFEILGFDLMIDDDLGVWLLEINQSPGIHLLTDVVNPHHLRAVESVMSGSSHPVADNACDGW